MSSLAATQADGYYVPPEYFESGAYQKKSKNQWHAATASQGKAKSNHSQPVVRFELPHSGVCEACDARIMRGTRYNATKIATDEFYFSTRIWEFRIQCRADCTQQFVIRTDPAARDFKYVSGIRLRVQTWDTVEAGSLGVVDLAQSGPRAHALESAAIASDLERLEVAQLGARRAQTEVEQLMTLQRLNLNIYRNDADRNAQIRRGFRTERQSRKRQLVNGDALGWRRGMSLLDHNSADEGQAKGTTFGDRRQSERQRWQKVRQSTIFSAKATCANTSSTPTAKQEVIPDQTASSSFTVKRNRRNGRECADVVDLTETSSLKRAIAPQRIVKRLKVVVNGAKGSLVNHLNTETRETVTRTHGSALDTLTAYDSDSD